MYWFVLILASTPLYLVIGWVVFDTGENAAATFWQTLVAILKMIFILPILRWALDMDTEGAEGLLPVGIFFAGCAALTYAEHLLLQRFVF